MTRQHEMEPDNSNTTVGNEPIIGSWGGDCDYSSQKLLYRFIRLNPLFDQAETLKLLKAELSLREPSERFLEPVPWMDPSFGFYAITDHFVLHQSLSYQQGRIYGQDVSSGAATAALLTNQYDQHQTHLYRQQKQNDVRIADPTKSSEFRILDLCCSPGLKLCAMADWFRQQQAKVKEERCCCCRDQPNNNKTCSQPIRVSLVGVDISEPRLATCKRIIQKYQIDPLFLSGRTQNRNIDDGTDNTNNLLNGVASSRRTSCTDNVNSDWLDLCRIRLYCHDGTTFGQAIQDVSNVVVVAPPRLVFDSQVSIEEIQYQNRNACAVQRKRKNKAARGRETKKLSQVFHIDWQPASSAFAADQKANKVVKEEKQLCLLDTDHRQMQHSSMRLFDRVLVDAECSTDGSIKHIQKRLGKIHGRIESTIESKSDNGVESQGMVSDALLAGSDVHRNNHPKQYVTNQQLTELVELQKNLAVSGFNLLKPGGYMVYSTCSMSPDQNEGVIQWLLEHCGEDAELVPLTFEHVLTQPTDRIQQGTIAGTARFLPNVTDCGAYGDPQEGKTVDVHNLFGGGFFLAKIVKRYPPR